MRALTDYSAGKRTRHRVDPDLKIAENIWSDEALLGLLEHWLVPAIVDRIVADQLNSAGEVEVE